MPNPWIRLMTTVPYRVYWVIFLLPDSPSLESFSRVGTTTVRSWRIIDALMYGMMPRAKTESLSSPPPANMSIKPRKLPAWDAIKAAKALPFTPGVGIWTPMRYTASSAKGHEYPALQLGNSSDVLKTTHYGSTSTSPP